LNQNTARPCILLSLPQDKYPVELRAHVESDENYTFPGHARVLLAADENFVDKLDVSLRNLVRAK